MVNKTSEDTETQKILIDLGIDPEKILCQFRFDNHDCLAVMLAEDIDELEKQVVHDCHSLTEICRFKVNGCHCVIMKKTADQEAVNESLSVVLSGRELQIATLVALGCPNKQVADKLHISEWTVATYLRRIYAKLGVDTRAAMTYCCASLICKQDAVLTR
jgi:DNA-binding CsgD family transcriptional regulator